MDKTHSWGMASFVLSILGLTLFLAPYIGIVCSILAVIFYNIQKKKEPTKLSTAGLVMGIIGIVFNGLMLIFLAGVLTLFSTTANSVDNLIPDSKISGANAEDSINQKNISLEIIDLSCNYGDYGWIYAKGRVKNNGNTEAKYVKVNIDLYDGDEWVDSDYTYIRNTDLSAGATDSFENTWLEDSISFTRCEAFVTYS